MNIQEAIKQLQTEHDLIANERDLDGSQFAPALLEALTMAIEALKAQNTILYMNLPEVSAEEAVEILKRNNRIELLPSAQPERKKGKWILDEYPHDGDCRCSVCLIAIDQMHERHHGVLNALTGGKWWRFYKFCPNCGADMRGEQDE